MFIRYKLIVIIDQLSYVLIILDFQHQIEAFKDSKAISDW